MSIGLTSNSGHACHLLYADDKDMGTPDSLDALIAAALRSAGAKAEERETPPFKQAPKPRQPQNPDPPIETIRREVRERTPGMRPMPPMPEALRSSAPRPPPPSPALKPASPAPLSAGKPLSQPSVREYAPKPPSIMQLLRDHRAGAAKELLRNTPQDRRAPLIQNILDFIRGTIVVLAEEESAAEHRFEEARDLIVIFGDLIPVDAFRRTLRAAISALEQKITATNEDAIATLIGLAEAAFRDILEAAPKTPAKVPASSPKSLVVVGSESPRAQEFEDLIAEGRFDGAHQLNISEEIKQRIVLRVFEQHIRFAIVELRESNGQLNRNSSFYAARKLFLAFDERGADEKGFADIIRLQLARLRSAPHMSHLLHSKISDAVATVFDAKLNW